MNTYLFFAGLLLMLLVTFSCNEPKTTEVTTHTEVATSTTEIPASEKKDTGQAPAIQAETSDTLLKFVPNGFVIVEKTYGDLNKDGADDCVLLVKSTDKKNFFKDESRGELDRNRRGLIVLFKHPDRYEMAMQNLQCFSSENEDGGVYYAPELSVDIKKGNLHIDYAHGRYGYWGYTFRFQHSDFELIGYDASENRGPVINRKVSINFLTRKKITEENTNEEAESGEEVFQETVTKLTAGKLIRLSEIKDFDELTVASE